MSKLKPQTRHLTATLVTTTSLLLAAAAGAATEAEANWDILGAVVVSEELKDDIWSAKKEFPPELVSAAKGSFDIEGFYVPVVAQAQVDYFLMVPDPSTCPFCGSGAGYGPSLEVSLKRPMADLPEGSKILVRGTLVLIDDPETYQAYRMVDADVIARP